MSITLLLEVITLTLIHFVWQGAVIGLMLGLVLNVIRMRDASTTASFRHLAALVALFAIVLSPILTFLLLSQQTSGHEVMQLSSFSVAYTDHQATDPLLNIPRQWLSVLLLAWVVGVVWGSGRLMLSWISLKVLQYTHRAITPEWLRMEVLRLQRQAGVGRNIKIVVSYAVVTPLTAGCIRPVLILPATLLTGMPGDQLKLILLHELAHIRRCDYLVNWLQNTVSVLLFYHPVVHWVGRILSEERELCCDYSALSSKDNPVDYAKALLTLQQQYQQPQMALAASGKGVLLNRLQRLLNQEADTLALSSNPGRPFACLMTIIVSAVVTLSGVMGSQQSQAAYQSVTTHIQATQHPLSRVNQQVSGRLERIQEISRQTSLSPQYLSTRRKPPVTAVAGGDRKPKTVQLDRFKVVAAPDAAIRRVAISAQKKALDMAMQGVIKSHLTRADSLLPDLNVVTAKPGKPSASMQYDALPISKAMIDPLKPKASDVRWTIDSLQPPEPIHVVKPIYPLSARRFAKTVSVHLTFSIDANGEPFDIVSSDDKVDRVFTRAASRALKKWRFAPGGVVDSDIRIGQRFNFVAPLSNLCQTGSRLCTELGGSMQRVYVNMPRSEVG